NWVYVVRGMDRENGDCSFLRTDDVRVLDYVEASLLKIGANAVERAAGADVQTIYVNMPAKAARVLCLCFAVVVVEPDLKLEKLVFLRTAETSLDMDAGAGPSKNSDSQSSDIGVLRWAERLVSSFR